MLFFIITQRPKSPLSFKFRFYLYKSFLSRITNTLNCSSFCCWINFSTSFVKPSSLEINLNLGIAIFKSFIALFLFSSSDNSCILYLATPNENLASAGKRTICAKTIIHTFSFFIKYIPFFAALAFSAVGCFLGSFNSSTALGHHTSASLNPSLPLRYMRYVP